MSPTPPTRRRPPTRRPLWAVVLAAAALAATAAAAADTVPADGAIVDAPPSILRVDVDAPVASGTIRLFDDAGVQIPLPLATLTETALTTAVPALPDGRYLAAWNIEPGGRSGAWTFTVAATGTGASTVDRAIAASGGPLAAVLAAVAAIGSVLLAAAAVDGPARPGRATALAAVTVGAALGTAAVADPTRHGTLVDALRAATGRPWAVVALGGLAAVIAALTGSFPHRGSPLIARIAAGVAATVVLAGVARGLAGAFHLSQPPVAALLALAWMATVAAGRGAHRVALAAVAVAAITIGSTIALTTDPAGVSADRTTGGIRLEASVQPAGRGANELHLYAYEPGRGIAHIDEATARAWNLDENVGPLDIPLLRAGPHHFLTYAADLPLAGTWRIVLSAVDADGSPMTVELRFEAR